MKKCDVVIIGSGAAALQLAKELSGDLHVIMITKSTLKNGNSNLAQGGIAAAIGRNDHPEKHVADTLEAGRCHNDRETVRAIAKEAPALIRELLDEGCPFDRDHLGEPALGMEGAHSEKRIVHGGGDATGATLMKHLSSRLPGNLQVYENQFAYELIIAPRSGHCIGVKAKDPAGRIGHFLADHVVLATGGCGQLYSHTSNAPTVTGDGIALAYRAGAEIADMEFIQFHPTLLFADGQAKGLVTEAVRGEGGKLVDEKGRPVMAGIHPLGDLAPRHVVAQTIYSYLREGKPVYLDVSHIKHFSKKFPTVAALCEKNGIDWNNGIPVAPGSHFLMGGIKTDVAGRTHIPGLYAIGEAACTGLHGANRLASNSLLEGLFMGKKLAEWINGQPSGENMPEWDNGRPPSGNIAEWNNGQPPGENTPEWINARSSGENMPEWDNGQPSAKNKTEWISAQSSAEKRPLRGKEEIPNVAQSRFRLPKKEDMQRSMMDHAGIVRTEAGLKKHMRWLESFHMDKWMEASLDALNIDEIERIFMGICSWLITDAALKRTESRGGHFRLDFPCENDHEWAGKRIIQCRKRRGRDEQIKTPVAAGTIFFGRYR